MKLRFGLLFIVTVVAASLLGCQSLLIFFPPAPDGLVNINAVRTGCSETSRSVAFTATPADPTLTYQWFFTDGTSLVGTRVVHTFAQPGTHDVNLLVNGQITQKRITVPLRGDSDGEGDPFGDRCVPNEGDTHVPVDTTVQYTANPPASGPHYSAANVAPVDPGVYTEAIKPERWIHNLEHGRIVVLYDCPGDCPATLLQDFETLLDSVPPSKFGNKKLMVTRYSGLQVPIMAIAWDVQRDFQAFDLQGLIDFYNLRVDHGPEDEP